VAELCRRTRLRASLPIAVGAFSIVPTCLTSPFRPVSATATEMPEAEWRLALDDGGRFLDAWGVDAATMGWAAGELFEVPRGRLGGGLVWRLNGGRVDALGEDRARLADDRVIGNQEFRRARK
jgi:hypothetical protein